MVSYDPEPIPVSVEVHLIINIVVLLVTITVVGLRIISRRVAGTQLGWDDYLALLSLPQAIGMMILQGLCKSFKIGVFGAYIRVGTLANNPRFTGAPTGVGYDLVVATKNWNYIYAVSCNQPAVLWSTFCAMHANEDGMAIAHPPIPSPLRHDQPDVEA